MEKQKQVCRLHQVFSIYIYAFPDIPTNSYILGDFLPKWLKIHAV